MAEDKRPLRICEVCGGVDDHPRHVYGVAEGDGVTDPEVAALAISNVKSPGDLPAIIAQVQDTSTIMRHMDCCREAGCPDGTCHIVTAGAESLRGAKLLAHIQGGKR